MSELVREDAGELLRRQARDEWKTDRQHEPWTNQLESTTSQAGGGVHAAIHLHTYRRGRANRRADAINQDKKQALTLWIE